MSQPSLKSDPKNDKPKVVYEDALYLASATDLLARLRRVPARNHFVMLIGHNPGLHDLALALAEAKSADAVGSHLRATKFPTSTLAVLRFDASSWTKVKPGSGHVTHFMTPSRLEKARAAAHTMG